MATVTNNANTGPVVIAINSVLAVIATFLIVLRFWSRRLTGAGWRIDDYLALAALLFQHAIYGLSNEAILFILCFLYGTVSPLIKVSVLFFYGRIFPTRTVKIGTYLIGSLCVGWFIAIITVNAIQCHPTSNFWNLAPTEGSCINLILYFVGNSAANCVIDVLTLTLPIREVLRLHVSANKKAGLGGIFLLGGLVVVASLIRTISLGVLYRDGVTNITQQYVVCDPSDLANPSTTLETSSMFQSMRVRILLTKIPKTMWIATTVEIYIAIIGACLPTIVPAYRKLRYGNALEGSSATSRSFGTPLKGSVGNRIGSGHVKMSARSHVHGAGEGAFELLPHGAQTGSGFYQDPAEHYVGGDMAMAKERYVPASAV